MVEVGNEIKKNVHVKSESEHGYTGFGVGGKRREEAAERKRGGVASLLQRLRRQFPLKSYLRNTHMKKMLIKHPQTEDMDQRFWIEFAR